MAKNSRTELQEIMARIAVRAWTDDAYADRLRNDAATLLSEEGVAFPDECPSIIFHFDTPKERHFVIPSPPESLSLAESDLKVLAAQRLSIQLELF